MTLSAGAREYVLGLADDEHMVGARHTSWIGLGPFLEEDLAFCSIAQDELGHAIALYELLLADEPTTSLDEFAMMRSPGEYRSCHLAERECADWNDSLVRHWLYDRAETIRWNALTASTDERLALIAARALREETFHLAHADQFLARITRERPVPILASIDALLPIAMAVFDPVDGESDALADGITSTPSGELAEKWEAAIRSDLTAWNLDIDWPDAASVAAIVSAQESRRRRTDTFDVFQADLRKVIDLDPAATW